MNIHVCTCNYNQFINIIQETMKQQNVTSKKKANVSPADQAGKTSSSLSPEQQSMHKYNNLGDLILNV